MLSGPPLTGLYYDNVDMNRCSSTTGFGQLSSFTIVCLIPIVSHCGGRSRLISFTTSAQLLSAFQGHRGCESYVQAVQTGRAIPMQEFTADLKHRMRGVWRDEELVDSKLTTN